MDIFQNQWGCDSLYRQYFTIRDSLPILDSIEFVCDPSEVGIEPIISPDSKGCSSIIQKRSVLGDPADFIRLKDDVYEIAPAQRLEFLDPLQNDTFPSNYEFELISQPQSGSIELEEVDGIQTGKINFTAPNQPQNIKFEYQICVNGCPRDWCKTASITFSTNCQAQLETAFVKLISPNGDGKNDVFDPLEAFLDSDCPLDPAKINLMIANRSGEIVYRTLERYQPWEGQGSDGTELPNGTYYFILKIDGDRNVYKSYIDLIR